MKEATLSDNCRLLGKLKLESLMTSSDHTWEVGSARTEIPVPFPSLSAGSQVSMHLMSLKTLEVVDQNL